MNDIEKRLKLKIDIPDAKSIEKLSKDLADIDNKITRLNARKKTAEDSKVIDDLSKSKTILEEELATAIKLYDTIAKIKRGEKLSSAEEKDITGYYQAQARAQRKLNAYTTTAAKKEQRAALQSELMSAGYSIGDANVYSAKGMDADDVEAAQSAALKTSLSAVTSMANGIVKGANAFNGVIKDTFGISLNIKDTFKDMLAGVSQAFNATTGIASYDVGSSLFVNRNARGLQLRYGLTASQAYGFQQASSVLGFDTSSLTDYMYMNDRQREVFNAYMEKSSAWYDRLTSSGVLSSVQELQLEFSLLKQELSMQFLSFIAENKDTIMALLQGVFDVASAILNILPGSSTATNLIGASESLTTSNSSKTINIKVESNNTATGVVSDQNGLMEQFNQWGNNLAAQIATATGG